MDWWWRGHWWPTLLNYSRRESAELILHHVVRERVHFSSSSTFPSVFCSLDLIRDLYHQVSVGHARILGAHFGHGFICCLLNFLRVAIFDILMQWAATSIDCAKMFIVNNIFGTDVAGHWSASVLCRHTENDLPLPIPTMRACHLVAPQLLHKWLLAAVAMPN
jgi:hypothetical protein